MRQPRRLLGLSACALALGALLTACGGGGATPPDAVSGSSGFAVDGYLNGATVLCDLNGNGLADIGEATVETDSGGFFKFKSGCSGMLVATGGKDIDTKQPFHGKLRAPAGSIVITPLTTLLAEGMTLDQVNTALGLPEGTDLKNTDPAVMVNGQLANPDLMRKTLALQQVVQETTDLFAALAGAGGDAAKPAIYSEVMAAVVSVLRTGVVLGTGTTLNQSVIASIIKAAADRVGASSVLSSEVRNGVKSVNSQTLADVIAGSVKAQAEAILKSPDASLIAVTTTTQTDTQISTFVLANKAALAGATSSATSTLATTLTTQVAASLGGGAGGGTGPAAGSGNTGSCTTGSCVDFSGATVGFLAFGDNGGGFAAIANDPVDATNKVLKIVKKPGDLVFLGTQVFTTVTSKTFAPAIALTSTNNTITLRVYSPAIGEKIHLKVEQGVSGAADQEIEVSTTKASAWETLSFTFPTAGTYNGVDILPHFGTTVSADTTFYFDELKLPAPAAGGGGGGGAGGGAITGSGNTGTCTTTAVQNCITFSETTIGFNPFEGLGSAAVVNDPGDAANTVAKYLKVASGGLYAGATLFTTSANMSVPAIDFATSKLVRLRAASPAAGVKYRLKFEDAADNTHTVEVDATSTAANTWETLVFDFSTVASGTAALNPAFTYNKVTIFPLFAQKVSAETAYYVDELKYAVASGGGGGGVTAPTNAPTTSIPSGSITIYSDAASATGLNMAPDWGQSNITRSEVTIAGNKSEKYVFGGAPFLYQGIDWTGPAGTSTIDVSAKSNLHLDLWSSDIASIKISLIGSGESAVTRTLTAGIWNSIDIDLALYTGVDKTKTIQLKLEPVSAGTLYVDNVYFSGGGAVSCGTTAPTCAPTTSIPSGSITVYSDASSVAGLNMAPDWGQSNVTRSEETIAGNKSEKYVFGGAPFLYQGIDWTGAAGTTTIDVSAKGSLHLDLWSADIASIKISLIGSGENAVTKTLTAGSWNSIDIDLALYTGVDKTKTIQLKLEPLTAGTLYADNIYFWGTAAASGGGGGVFAGGVYADDYVGTLPSLAKSTQGGDVGFFYDTRFDGAGNSYTYGGVSGTAQDPAGVHNFYFGLGLNAPAITNGYFGGFVKSPGNAPVSVASFTNLKLNVWGPDQLFKAGSFPTLKVVMQGPAAAGCSSNSGGSEVQVTFPTTTQGAASIYTLPLGSFTLVAGCGGDTTVAQVLAHIAQVNVLLIGTNIQYVNKDPNNVAFTNGLNIGSIKFN